MESEILSLGLPALLFLMAAAFFAGFIDSVAGGGGLVSLPATLLAGIPPQLALGTGKFMASTGTTFAFIAYARNNMVAWRVVAVGLFFSLAGSAAGSKTALYLSNEVLGKVLLFLLPLAALLTFMPIRKAQSAGGLSWRALYLATPIICAAIGFYDGFFGPGTGSLLLLSLHFFVGLDLVRASGTTKAFNLASNLSGLAVFLLNGKVLFLAAVPMALANVAGNLLGTRLAIRQGPALIRKVLIFSLSLLFATLIWRYYFQD